jgi:hypothetical protein
MPSPWDASIKLLDPVDDNTQFSIDDVPNAAPFDVIANVEIGENLNEHVDEFVLRVAIRNLTASTTVATEQKAGALTPANNQAFLDRVKVDINNWSANVGDVLQAVASYKVVAGINTDFSTAESKTFVVS